MLDIPSGFYGDDSKSASKKAAVGRRPRRSPLWHHIGGRRVRVMKKLDQPKVEYIIAEKRKGTKNAYIAKTMHIIVRYVQKLWARFKNTPKDMIVFPAPMGRPRRSPPAPKRAVICANGPTQAPRRGKSHMESPKECRN